MERSVTMKEVVYTHLHGKEYATEIDISGKQTYFHGSPELVPLKALSPVQYGKYKCTFFTTYFGYALSFAFPMGSVDKYRSIKEFCREVVFDKPMYPKPAVGYIYQIMIQPRPMLLDLNNSSDAWRVATILSRNNKITGFKNDDDVWKFMVFMREHDWLALEYKETPENIYNGISRDMFLDMLYKEPNIVGFFCYEKMMAFNNYGYPAIGMFQNKIPEKITQHKPMRVKYVGERFNHRKNANEYVVSIKSI